MSVDMATGSSAALHVPQFSGENYQIWVVKMRSYLKSFGLWEYVAEDKQVPALRANPTIAQIKQHEEEKMKRDKAITCLHSALTDSVFTTIMHLETAKEIWDELKERYEGSERVKNVKMLTLKREFEMLKMKESESVKDYSSKLSDLVNQMRLYGETVEDYKVVEKMLISLPKKFEAKVAAIEESCDLKKLTISEMINKLQAQEQRMSMRSNDATEGKIDGGSSETAGKSKFPPCSICKRPNHLSKDCWYKGKQQIQCHFCKKWGHIEKFCRSKPQHAQQANFTDEQPEAEDHMFMASQECCSASKDVWYVDSGCTSHMVKDSSLFTSLDSNDRTNVKLGNGEMVQATGKGTVSVQTSKGLKLIHDVLLIPDLDQNLLSVAQLLKKGYSCLFKDNYCTIVDSCGVEVVKVGIHDNSFPLNLEQVNHSAFVSKLDDSALWHKRYGHFNMDVLKYLQEHDMVRDMQAISHTSDDLCDACQLGKMHRKPFSSENVTRAKNKLELVHTDLCGPMSVPTYSQNNVFKKFRAMVESESGCKIKKLRSDNGKEYTSNEFNMFCEDMGITHQLTVSYTPQQNGVSEKKNRTVMEMARCLMAEKKLPKNFWAEAVYTAVYLLNKLPTRAVQGKTPIEAWSGVKPSAKHLKVFGSICYSHVADAKRSKLDDKAEMGIFLGYVVNSKGYRVFNLQAKKLIISRDIQVDEDAYWDWENDQIQRSVKSSQLTDIPTTIEEEESMTESDSPVLKTKSLAEIYERCNFAPSLLDCNQTRYNVLS
ncbi:hypothetical protein EZV62_027900 [Acer yangbiense]|uniref:Integrase catalytic domain-containing protein n=1 Tax=Acer yangbiense TaxID=1000413 RepID=A0A5C7GPV7_9ROSI|nr:hypothetical protein EZV62_027900 [Acer yangbiense]